MTEFTLTKLRADILNILKAADKPLKAYDILERLREQRPNAQPPTVYRVLEFLKDRDAVHEITNQHSYVLCQTDSCKNEHPTNILLVCSNCDQVNEENSSAILRALMPLAEQCHFQPTSSTIELLGLCQQCQQQGKHYA